MYSRLCFAYYSTDTGSAQLCSRETKNISQNIWIDFKLNRHASSQSLNFIQYLYRNVQRSDSGTMCVCIWKHLFHCMGRGLSIQLQEQQIGHEVCWMVCRKTGLIKKPVVYHDKHKFCLCFNPLQPLLRIFTIRSTVCAFGNRMVIEWPARLNIASKISQSSFITSSDLIDRLQCSKSCA